jgi:hypothetical protein
MNLKLNLKFLIAVITTLLVSSNIALAVPSQPHWFYGSVDINGSPAPDGTTIVAKINGIDVASTTTLDGKYGYEPMFFVPDTDPSTRPGATISFFVNDVNTYQTAIFSTNGITKLDLTAVGEEENGNGDGRPRGTDITTTTTIPGATTTTICQERWTCTDWSSCENGLQTRTCTEENNCGTDLYKPFESQPCGTEETKREALSITGLLSLIPSQAIIGIITLALIIIIFFGWRRIFRKKTTTSMNELSIEIFK